MVKDDYYWLHFKINRLLSQYIITKWYFRDKLESAKIFQAGGALYGFRDGNTIKELILYYEEMESYERCEMLKDVLDGLEAYCH